MSAAEPPTIHKPTFFEELLKNCRIVAVYVDTSSRSRAVLPMDRCQKPTCSLHYGLNLPKDIPDLRIDGGGIYATLSFGQEAFATFVPWKDIWRMEGYTGEGLVQHTWYEDVPVELVRKMRKDQDESISKTYDAPLPPYIPGPSQMAHDRWGHMVGPEYDGPAVGWLVPGNTIYPTTPPRGYLHEVES